MSTHFYDQYEQKIHIVPEETYGKPYNSGNAAFVAPDGDYPFLQRLNVIPEGIDVPMPRITKERLFDIGAGKHPSHIASTNYEPESIDIEAILRNPQFLGYAIGDNTTTHQATAEVTEITVDFASCVNGDYFLFWVIDDDDGSVDGYRCYMDVSGDDSGAPTAITGITDIRIDFITGDGTDNQLDVTVTDSTELAAEIDASIDNVIPAADMVPSNATGVLTLTNVATGAVPDARDSGEAPCGITVNVTTQGASTHTIEERLTTEPRSFSLYCEQLNTETGESIIYWLFGCVIEEYTLDVVMDDGTIKETVTFMCPYGVEIDYINKMQNANVSIGNECLYVWGHAAESASNYLLMDGTTDITPKSVEEFKLTIAISVEIKGDIGLRYRKYPITGPRDISLSIVGFIDKNDFLDRYINKWDCSNNKHENATSYFNSVIYLARTASSDDIKIIIDNLIVDELDFHFMSFEEGIKSIDITLVDAPPTQTDRKLIGAVVNNSISSIEMS